MTTRGITQSKDATHSNLIKKTDGSLGNEVMFG
jgi:hypothetical protein